MKSLIEKKGTVELIAFHKVPSISLCKNKYKHI